MTKSANRKPKKDWTKAATYGPYVVTPPSSNSVLPMYRVNGPALDFASTCAQSSHLRAMEANAAYQAGVHAAAAERIALLAACKAALSLLEGESDALVRQGKRNAALNVREFERMAREAIAAAEGGWDARPTQGDAGREGGAA